MMRTHYGTERNFGYDISRKTVLNQMSIYMIINGKVGT